jgi:hypothetical protein
MRLQSYAVSISMLLIWMPRHAESEVVYDTITDATDFGGGIILGPGSQGGNVVQLAGRSRIATRLDVVLYEFDALLPGDLIFKVNLWDSVGVPGNLLWSSPTEHASFPSRIPTVFGIDIPRVQVPDTLGWTVEGISNLYDAGVVYASPKTVGNALGDLIFNPPSDWFVNRYPANTAGGIGFRLTAIPEPKTGVQLALGFVAIFAAALRRRNR